MIEQYFTRLFQSTTANGSLTENEKVQRITNEDNENLISEITNEEVKAAVFSMHPVKSPGVDGLNPTFFQTYWNTVGTDVVQFCQNFMRTGELSGDINRTVVF